MSIYKKNRTPSKVYRKIYERHHGVIPKDDQGRTYEIHHIDGNDTNNLPENLVALSINDHYELHYQQKDWVACLAMSHRMKLSPEEKSNIARKAMKVRMSDPSYVNPFSKRQDGSSVASDRVAAGFKPKIRVGPENNMYDPTIYSLENIFSNEVIAITISEFKKLHSFAADKVSAIINKGKVYKGWRLYSPIKYTKPKRVITKKRVITDTSNFRHDRRIYHFVHLDGEEVKMTQRDFQKKFSLVGSNVSRLVSGERKSHQGWRLAA